MHRRTKATSISRDVKRKVYLRDKCSCILCHRYACPEWACAHVIPRSRGGMGVEQNIVTLCPVCHRRYDTAREPERTETEKYLTEYLEGLYGPISRSDVVFDKWRFLK